ncbi:hypothetical protein like AT5G57610 [Hibiscus trionum]|uniref:Protein kinase domain-containing protein n=1 Tax=Hibiscus trionum TaxID=183268 RepID=A0A9W7J2Z8_HIBTR|nr:hypothetical protein like AT5G57610 [Hibiscus trionum]
MDSTSSTPASALAPSSPCPNDETPHIKFLCSFLGSILPRPQDGKLRYVGGETRILSVSRDIGYEELMSKMRELYDGAAVLKYQQPDEDLDALVSVVNDDDVINMMEEYEKLGSADAFTRLRIFLFPNPDQDGLSHYVDGDDRETERRYVDALNSLNEGPDFRKSDSPVMAPASDDFHLAEQFFNSMSIDAAIHSQRSGEMFVPPYNLHNLTIPRMGSGQLQQPVPQRYNEMEGQWSPAYYSPRHAGHHDPRTPSEFPVSPSARYRVPFPDVPDKCLDQMPEDYVRQQLNHHLQFEHQPQFSDNLVWMPTGAISGDKAGVFPANMLHGHGVYEGNNICEHCRATFSRNQPPLMEHSNMGKSGPQVNNPCAECPPNQESFMLNADGKLHHVFHSKDQTDPISPYGEVPNYERGMVLQHQLKPRPEEMRNHVHGAGRLNDHYVLDGAGMNLPLGHATLADGHHLPSNYVLHRTGSEFGNEAFHDQTMVASTHTHIPLEEGGVRYGNYPHPYGGDNIYQASHGHVHVHAQPLWRNVQSPTHGALPYEVSGLPQQVSAAVNSTFLKGRAEGSARLCVATDNQNPWVESSQKMLGFDGTAVQDNAYGHALEVNVGPHGQETQLSVTIEPDQSQQDMLNIAPSTEPAQLTDQHSTLIHDKSVSSNNSKPQDDINPTGALRTEDKIVPMEDKGVNHDPKIEKSDVPSMCCLEQNKITENIASVECSDSNFQELAEKGVEKAKSGEKDPSAAENSKLSVNRMSFIPEFVASVKKAALEEVEEVKVKVKDGASMRHDAVENEAAADESESVNAHAELELDYDNDNVSPSKIEPTKAEEEAIARGLQTIKHDDLEDIRELGSGTYGAVYHGKWKGSDVAIKRIKASCFAGRPSERERLIADFWKEALILSSLHHPNVVSFYGIVRDGPDGSLATVTEFMVNGSLKQFLRKKDRTIDRRKRLIIAMDAAFGMEYLHGKNIVHFDLKCENLLVNMRDPHRPVCKIGDLGLSKVRQHTLVSGGVRGTLPWMAPELLSGKSNMVSEKIDVYSFGIVMWELLTGEEPYADMHCASIIGGIVNDSLRPTIPAWCDPEWKALMEQCWASDPAERPSFSEISQKLRNMAAGINVK